VRQLSLLWTILILTVYSFWGVFWVDVSDPSTARSGFASIATAVNSSAKTIAETLQLLARNTRRWLLILDNADDPKHDYAEYFPSCERGAILLTSRNPQCQDYSTVGTELLQGLSMQDSIHLLLTASHILPDTWSTQQAHAHFVVNLLGSHTLAIIQAGAYVAQGYSTLEDYSRRYQDHCKRLLQHHPDQQKSRYRNVYATFEASIDILIHSHDDAGSDALDLLATLSMLHWSMVPLQLFHDAWAGARELARRRGDSAGALQGRPAARPSRSFKNFWKAAKYNKAPVEQETISIETLGQEHVAQLPALVGAHLETWDDHRLKRASAFLDSLSLVTRHNSEESNGLSMHPLAHAWAKERLSKDEQQRTWISAACVCALSRGMSRTWLLSKDTLQPHIRTLIPPTPAVLFSYGPQGLILPIVIHCGWILNFTWEHKSLDNLLAAIYQDLGITSKHPERKHMPIWRLAATAALHLHHTKLAISLLEFIMDFDRSTSHRFLSGQVPTMYNLGRAYNDNGQYEKAITVLERAVFHYRATPTDKQWILSSQFELNRAYNAVGMSREAIELLQQVLRGLETAKGKEAIHDRLRAQHALAIAYIANKQTKDAINLLEDVVGTYETLLDEAHPDRITAQHELARAYKSDGQSDKSLSLLKHIVAIQERTLDKTDYILVASQYTLGTHYLASKDTDLALKLLQHVVNVYSEILDETQSERLSAEYALALAYVDAKEPEKALALMRRVVGVRERVLDKGHPHRVQSERLLRDLEDGSVYD
jgi:tetratricopeptide (TPR) repeat protein